MNYFGLPPLKIEGHIIPFDGPPLSEAQQDIIRKRIDKREKRNLRRRQRYAERKAALVKS